MTFKQFLSNIFSSQQKFSEARNLTTLQLQGRAVSSPANYETFSKIGYGKNAIVFKCISLIANACAGIDLELYSKKNSTKKKKTKIEKHALLDLLMKPNPMQSGFSFMEALIAYRLITGNTFIEANEMTNPTELWPLRPDRMKIIAGTKGYPAAYEYALGGYKKTWPVDFVEMKSQVLHMKTFNPANDWFGQSPLEAAIYAMDAVNSANLWNLGLFQHNTTPSGVLQVDTTKSNPRGELSEDQYTRLKNEFAQNYSGSHNGRKPLILEGGLMWQQISLSPQEMDFINSKNVSAVELCFVYGVPPEMAGLGVKTYNNYKEARQAFYEDTVLPLMDVVCDELTRWLAPMFNADIEIGYCTDDIEALVEKRESKYTTLKEVNWLTLNEKRAQTGQDEVEGGDIFIINNQAVENLEDLVSDGEDDVDPDDPNAVDPNDPNAEDDEDMEDDEDAPTDDEGKSLRGVKSFNLITANDRKQNRRRINARRKEIEKQFQTALEKDFEQMNAAIVKAGKEADPKLLEYAMIHALSKSIGTFRPTLTKYINQTLREFGSMIFNEAKSDLYIPEKKANTRRYEDFVRRYVEKRAGEAITQIEGTTMKKVRQVVKRLTADAIVEGESNIDVASELQKEFGGLTASRAQLIARTEVGSASTKGSMEAVRALEIPGMLKVWNSVQDDRTRDGEGEDANHLDMDGVSVPIDEKFTVPPDASMEAPGDPTAGADQVCNCRCTLTYKLAKPGAE